MKSFISRLNRPRLGGVAIGIEPATVNRRPEERLAGAHPEDPSDCGILFKFYRKRKGIGSDLKMGNEVMSIESVIHQSLDYACTSGWDSLKQTEFAARVAQQVRPDWSDLEARSAVDWVRSRATDELRAF